MTHSEDKMTPIKSAPSRLSKKADILDDKGSDEVNIAKQLH